MAIGTNVQQNWNADMTIAALSGPQPERYLSIPAAAKLLGIPASTLRRAINSNLLPYHTPFSTRRRVLISEVRAAVAAAKVGGEVQHDGL